MSSKRQPAKGLEVVWGKGDNNANAQLTHATCTRGVHAHMSLSFTIHCLRSGGLVSTEAIRVLTLVRIHYETKGMDLTGCLPEAVRKAMKPSTTLPQVVRPMPDSYPGGIVSASGHCVEGHNCYRMTDMQAASDILNYDYDVKA